MPYADSVYNPEVAIERLQVSLLRCVETLLHIADDDPDLRSHDGFIDVIRQADDTNKYIKKVLANVRTKD